MSKGPLTYPDRLAIARRPTPLESLPLFSKEWGVELWVKRDDLTGIGLSGNKIRKLEFLLQDALAKGANTVITCGGIQSNHARATALAAAKLGLKSILILRGAPPEQATGNLLLARLVNAEIRWVTSDEYQERDAIFAEEEARVRAKGGHPYSIPEGGSNALGALGYVAAMEEIRQQLRERNLQFDTVITAVGSGGTLAGLAVGHAQWPDDTPKPIGINVCDSAAYFHQRVEGLWKEMAENYEVPAYQADAFQIQDGFVGKGYALSSQDELDTISHVAQTTGVLLDPVYTGKAFFGLQESLRTHSADWGKRILFLHTGGLFGLFPKAANLKDVLKAD